MKKKQGRLGIATWMIPYCRKCEKDGTKHCHHCGREIDIFNHIDWTFIKYGKLHNTGRCCSD